VGHFSVEEVRQFWIETNNDFGLRPLEAVDRHDILELMDQRYGRTLIAIVSQLPVAQRYAALGDATLADAILDRVVHNVRSSQLCRIRRCC